jgi:hypothetical protein
LSIVILPRTFIRAKPSLHPKRGTLLLQVSVPPDAHSKRPFREREPITFGRVVSPSTQEITMKGIIAYMLGVPIIVIVALYVAHVF